MDPMDRDGPFNPLIEKWELVAGEGAVLTEEWVAHKSYLELFKQLDELLKPLGWPAQKLLRDYTYLVSKILKNPQ